ncbi:hypothetical protein, partial [Ferroplasma sp.]|uniref:hypothetical protein n=1 Tax=Ferroplasma sp. TaxID=2591003 RepID=UPI0026080A84
LFMNEIEIKNNDKIYNEIYNKINNGEIYNIEIDTILNIISNKFNNIFNNIFDFNNISKLVIEKFKEFNNIKKGGKLLKKTYKKNKIKNKFFIKLQNLLKMKKYKYF